MVIFNSYVKLPEGMPCSADIPFPSHGQVESHQLAKGVDSEAAPKACHNLASTGFTLW